MRRKIATLLLVSLFSTASVARAADPSPAEPHEVVPTRHVVTDVGPNRLLMASGAATFAFGYAGAVWVGATSTLATDRPLLIPFAGPWLALATRAPCGGETSGVCGHEATYDALLIADGLVQVAGIAQIALAFLHRDLRPAAEPVIHGARVHVTPARTAGGGLAIAASGAF
jgi:hypothetical protein